MTSVTPVSIWLTPRSQRPKSPRRAGHSVAVLLKVYVHCIDGQADTANHRIADVLAEAESA